MKLRFLMAAALFFVQGQELTTIEKVSASGRCADLGESADQRVAQRQLIAPGAPPLLSFRYYEGALHHKFGNSELLLDDAGH
jgi:hypothetical protein